MLYSHHQQQLAQQQQQPHEQLLQVPQPRGWRQQQQQQQQQHAQLQCQRTHQQAKRQRQCQQTHQHAPAMRSIRPSWTPWLGSGSSTLTRPPACMEVSGRLQPALDDMRRLLRMVNDQIDVLPQTGNLLRGFDKMKQVLRNLCDSQSSLLSQVASLQS